MAARAQITFDGFILDPENEVLWKGRERIRLRPKTYALLLMLAERSGQLVTKKELLNAIWKDWHVKGDEALKHCVAEIRQTLGDDADKPRFIETVSGRGYCFLKKTDIRNAENLNCQSAGGIPSKTSTISKRSLVGRASELSQLHDWLEKAMEGTRQVVFIAGDQGIGKTMLVDTFIDIVKSEWLNPNKENRINPLIARGQCIKSHGASEAYMPFMEAFTGINDKSVRRRIVAILKRYAPLWLSQMPSLATPSQLRNLRHPATDATRERMMREMAEALEVMTSATPMILVLEDLHWSDCSTLDLISYWAQRRGIARLLLIGTFRAQEITSNVHPLKTIKEELQVHRQCHELQIPNFSDADICEYLQLCFPGHKFPKRITPWLRERTGGNPLFMVNVLDQLIARDFLVLCNNYWILNDTLNAAAQLVPSTIQKVIERHIEQCSPEEQKLLKAASVEGVEFSSAGIAATVGWKLDKITNTFQSLARRNQFIQKADSGGKQVSCYRFAHALYQQTCYQLLPEELQVQYHRKLAGYIEKTNDNLGEFVSLLAMHFDRGQDPWNAIKYYVRSAEKANILYASAEALDLATRGLQLLSAIPESPDRIELEARLQYSLGTALLLARGGTKEVKLAFNKSRNLFQQLSLRRQSAQRALLFESLFGLWTYHWIHTEYAAALDFAEQMMQLAKAERNLYMLNKAHFALGLLFVDRGDFVDALKHLKKSPNVLGRSIAAVTLWNIGFPNKALADIEQIILRTCGTRRSETVHFCAVVHYSGPCSAR
jgi:predicted ATPase/DNA-binding winged helix-turn-helix (wHTH) protein